MQFSSHHLRVFTSAAQFLGISSVVYTSVPNIVFRLFIWRGKHIVAFSTLLTNVVGGFFVSISASTLNDNRFALIAFNNVVLHLSGDMDLKFLQFQ